MNKETDKHWTFLKVCGLATIIIAFCFVIMMIMIGLKQGIEVIGNGRMTEQLCDENNLTFVEDKWDKGNHCVKIENNIIERYFVDELNDGEFYLIKR